MKKIILMMFIMISGIIAAENNSMKNITKDNLSNVVESYTKRISKGLPKRGNKLTTLESVKWNEKTSEMIYLTKINGYIEEGFEFSFDNVYKEKEALKKSVQKNMIKKVCKKQNLKKLMKFDVIFKYNYEWEDGAKLFTFNITKETCK